MRKRLLRSLRLPLVCLLVLSGLSALGAATAVGERYYLLVFGSQRVPNEPNYSHSFATFVRVVETAPGCGPVFLESHTISWLPASMIVRTRALHPECGRNFDLHTTIRYALDNGERVSMWGPFEVQPKVYYRALLQISLLESGQVKYKAVDSGYRTSEVSNCIHAVGSVEEGYRLRVGSPGWGEMASYYLTRIVFQPYILEPEVTHPWVGEALGLEAYPIIYRKDIENPLSGGVRNLMPGGKARSRAVCPTYWSPGGAER